MQAVIFKNALVDNGTEELVGSVRNSSCITALLSVNNTYRDGRLPLPAPIYLLLVDQQGLEDLLDTNQKIFRLPPHHACQAGQNLNTTSCAFTASGLNPGQAYHFWLYYQGNKSALGDSYDARVTATFAMSHTAGVLLHHLFQPSDTSDNWHVTLCHFAPCISIAWCIPARG